MQVSPLRQNTKYQTADLKKICNLVHIHSPLITQIFPHPHGGPLLPVTLALSSSLWQPSTSKDHAEFMEDAKVLLAEEIKSILREFGFNGEIAGPQERRKLIWYY